MIASIGTVAGCLGGCADPENAVPAPMSPVGQYRLALTTTNTTPCPAFTLPTELRFTVRDAGAGVVFHSDDGAVTVEDGTFAEDGGGIDRFLRVQLTTTGTWPSPEGSAYPQVAYELSVEANGDVTGGGEVDFDWGGTTCRYTFAVSGREDGVVGGGAPIGTPPVVIATATARPQYLALDADAIYWIAAGQIWRVPRAGGVAQPLLTDLAPDTGSLDLLAVDSAGVAFGYRPFDGGGGTVRRIAHTGGPSTILASGLGPGELVSLTAVGGTVVYGTSRQLWRVNGGAPELLADVPGLPLGLTAAGAFVYTGTGGSERLARVLRLPIAGGAAQGLASDLGLPWQIAIDGDTVYFTDYYLARVHRAPAAGGPDGVLVQGERRARGLALSEHVVYYANDYGGESIVRRVAPGDAPVTIYRGARTESNVLVQGPIGDDAGVYWFDGDRLFARVP